MGIVRQGSNSSPHLESSATAGKSILLTSSRMMQISPLSSSEGTPIMIPSEYRDAIPAWHDRKFCLLCFRIICFSGYFIFDRLFQKSAGNIGFNGREVQLLLTLKLLPRESRTLSIKSLLQVLGFLRLLRLNHPFLKSYAVMPVVRMIRVLQVSQRLSRQRSFNRQR